MTGWLKAHPLSAAGLVVLAPLSIGLFAVAFLRAPAPEVATVNAAAGAAATVAVTLISVEAALRLEERRRAKREWREWQTRLLEEADEWAREVIMAFEAVADPHRTGVHLDRLRAQSDVHDEHEEPLNEARSRITLEVVEGMERLLGRYSEFERRAQARVAWLEDAQAAAALDSMLGDLKGWIRNMSFDDAAVIEEYLPGLRDQAEVIRWRYAEAVPEQYRVAGG